MPAEIEQGKAEVLRHGDQVLILALGSMVYPAFEAAELLDKENIGCTVVNARFVKPLDEALFLELAKGKQWIVTVEEGVLAGGFGSAVIEFFEKHERPPIQALGLPDRFIEHGKRESLLDSLGLSAQKIKDVVLRLVQTRDVSFRDDSYSYAGNGHTYKPDQDKETVIKRS